LGQLARQTFAVANKCHPKLNIHNRRYRTWAFSQIPALRTRTHGKVRAHHGRNQRRCRQQWADFARCLPGQHPLLFRPYVIGHLNDKTHSLIPGFAFIAVMYFAAASLLVSLRVRHAYAQPAIQVQS